MSEQYKVNIVQKKIITSLLYDSYHILITTFARIYTCEINSEYWLYTGLQGALVFCYKVDAKPYLLKFFLFDLKTFETLFECELYKKFDKAFKKGTERFFYFEINNGFIGIEIPNFDEANTFYARVLTAKDDYLKDVLKEFKPLKGDELKEKGKKMIHKLDKQFKDKENITNKMARTEIYLTIGKLEKEINTVDLDEDSGKLIINGTGYDHCYVLNKHERGELSFAAKIIEPVSGRTMEIYTTEPGVQLYTGNWLNGFTGWHGATFPARSAVCFEAQHFPDSPNRPYFPTVVLNPGETYRQRTIYKFGIIDE